MGLAVPLVAGDCAPGTMCDGPPSALERPDSGLAPEPARASTPYRLHAPAPGLSPEQAPAAMQRLRPDLFRGPPPRVLPGLSRAPAPRLRPDLPCAPAPRVLSGPWYEAHSNGESDSRRTRTLLHFLLALMLLFAAAPAATAAPWDDLEAEAVLEGLYGPIDFALAPDGAVWWNEYYTGNVTRYDPATGERKVMFHAPPIEEGVERGMVGLALDPDVVENGVFYVYYTVADPDDPDGGTNHLSRIEAGEETVLLTVPANKLHNGGRIEFASDGSMFVSTGDNNEGGPAQDPESRLGKILHLWPDGTPADDVVADYTYSMGHRNVYGLAYDPATDRLYATENNNAERDEVNRITQGGNYGWPHCAGDNAYEFSTMKALDTDCTDPRYTAPIGVFHDRSTVAPTGATIFQGTLYWGAWNQGELHQMAQDEAGRWQDIVVRGTGGGRINDVESDDTAIYYSSWTTIYRIEVPEGRVPGPAGVDGLGEDGTDGGNGIDPGPSTIPGLGAFWLILALVSLVPLLRRGRA